MFSVTYLKTNSMCLLSLQNKQVVPSHDATTDYVKATKTMVTHSSCTNMVPTPPSNLKRVDLSVQKHITRNIVTEATTSRVLRANTTFINDLKVAELVT